ncbi:E3 ubiquitin-protein ligase HUWE1-like, partial [Stegodyphus dumicola]|uniref:E3 ubiquitin-protein ligase HUWE1-like n=1 Tax=Stegodyphus dumicola TaxID=202533 RepID=UPI0015AD4AAE
TFHWALTCGNKVPIEEGLEHPELPDGTGEFLDAWLMLLEKLVNPKTVLESPHTLSSKLNQQGSSSFDPVMYLIHVHKRAFESIMYLWDRRPLLVYGERIADSILTIICHLLKGENEIKERLVQREEIRAYVSQAPPSSTASAATSANRIVTRSRRLLEGDDSSVNQDHLVQLVDMGFSRGLATEALLSTNSLEQATDYLLSYSAALGRGSTSGAASNLGMDWEMSEEDQMLRAIAMSLGENVLVSTNQVENEPNKTDEQKELEFEQQQEEPLSTQTLDLFTEYIAEACLRLSDALPETVHRVSELLLAVAERNGEIWCDNFLVDRFIREIFHIMGRMVHHLSTDYIPEERKGWGIGSRFPWFRLESKLAVRLHLFTLIVEEMPITCAREMERIGVPNLIIKVLESTAACMKLLHDEATPRWLPFMVMLIDQYDRGAEMTHRKAPLLMAPKRQWKWFDDRSGKWNNYTLTNNKVIDDAFKAGETSVEFTAGRRNYVVQLNTMTQINEETGNWRPILLVLEDKPNEIRDEDDIKGRDIIFDEATGDFASCVQGIETSFLDTQPVQIRVIKKLTPHQNKTLVRVCVTFLSVPLEPDALHAIMRLCLRLTRVHSNAVMFANMDGPKLLLSLTQPYSFIGFTSLTTLLFRHILEDSSTLFNTMGKVIRSTTSAGAASLFISKEMNYIFRVLSPLACRDPEIFISVASNTLRLAILPVAKRDEDDRYNNSYSVQMLKSCPLKSQIYAPDYPYNAEVANNLIYVLLNALTAKPLELPDEGNASPESNPDTLPSTDQPSPLRDVSGTDLLPTDDDDGLVIPLSIPNVDGFNDSTESISSPREGSRLTKDTSKDSKSESSSMKNIPIIRKSGICRILAELVRSYSQCARMITDYSFPVGVSELVTEDCTALAFILDNLLHSSQTAGDKETPALARVLIAAIASCNHCSEVQTTLVNEVRFALLRALSLPESAEKHARIQALTGLISTMIESCPSTSSQSQLSGCALRSQSSSMNNIVRLFLRKGIVVDLARIPHYLDLSSPHMATTVNCALKPLETLSRIVNLPSGSMTNKSKGKSSSAETRDSVPEAMEEDTSSGRCSTGLSILPYRAGHAAAATMDPALEGLMNEILEGHENSGDNEDQIPSDTSVEAGEQDLTVTVEMGDHSSAPTGSRHSNSFGNQTQ